MTTIDNQPAGNTDNANDELSPGVDESEATGPDASSGAERPDPIYRGSINIRSLALSVLMILAIFYTLYVARAVFMPLILALLMSLLLRPLVRMLHDAHIPTPIGAAIVLLGVIAAVGGAVYGLSTPAAKWVEELPRGISMLEERLHELQEPVEKVKEATKAVEKATAIEESPGIKVEMKRTSVASYLVQQAGGILANGFLTGALLYFLLASGDVFLRKLVKVIPRFQDKKQAVEIVHRIQNDIARYILAITTVNLGLGAAIGMAMYLLGLPNPILWGAMAATLNFVPYLGAACGTAIVGLAALVNGDTGAMALIVACAYIALSTLEGTVVTPYFLGQRLALNPVMIFLALTIWGWLWGIAGALMAVPIIAVTKIICDRIEKLQPIGEFLGK